MTFLKGSTTVATAAQDFYDLLTGQIAAANTGGAGANGTNGLQVSGVDAWTRLDVTNKVLRSKATQACLYGQWNFYRGAPRFEYQTVDPGYAIQLGKPTFTTPGGTYTGANRAYFRCYVTTSNTAAGNLTGLVVTWEQRKCLDGSVLFSGTLTGWSGSSATVAIRDGVSLTLTLGGSDTLAAGASAIYWLRGYSATYTQGIDYFPDAGKIDTTQTIVVSNTSGGTNNYTRATDYDLVGECDANPALNSGSTGCGGYCGNNLYGAGVMHGIHWKTGGSPPATGTNVYLVSCQCFAAYCKVDFAGASFTLQPCEYYDPVNTLPRHAIQGDSAFVTAPSYPFIPVYSTAGSVLSTNFINYWISVKRDKIVMALQGDSSAAAGGLNGVGTFQKYAVAATNTVEKTAWLVWGSASGAPPAFAAAGWWPNQYPNGHTVFTNTNRQQWTGASDLTYFGMAQSSLPAANPDAESGAWVLYNFGAFSSKNGKDTAGNISLSRAAGFKGLLQGIFQLATDNFNDYNDLAATGGGATYLLLARSLYNSGGAYIAILEE